MFDNSYAALPERFYVKQPPAAVPEPALVRLNEVLAQRLGLDAAWLASNQGVAMLAGNHVPDDAEPLAMAYAGHQFGGWVPQLGDGRAILLGEVVAPDRVRFDCQLKGAGRTPFSRGGDGRAVLGPVLREYIVSEAMAAFGIPTTRALSAVTTGDSVMREGLFPGAVLCRIATSHIRVGTFEFFAARQDAEALTHLADYVVGRYFPDFAARDEPYLALYDHVVGLQASLIARWMGVGFIHGVMNTDNMNIAGETIDYGPCAFMDDYDPKTVFSSIDHAGRYAYGNQPYIAQWNLACLARAMLPILDADRNAAAAKAQEVLDGYPDRFQAAWLDEMRKKLGLAQAFDEDAALVNTLFDAMAENKVDFTAMFRHLSDCKVADRDHDAAVRALFAEPDAFDRWALSWRRRLQDEQQDDEARMVSMKAVNPAFIPRNHRVEEVLAAANEGDTSLLDDLLTVLEKPFEDHPALAHLQTPPRMHEVVQATFCGT